MLQMCIKNKESPKRVRHLNSIEHLGNVRVVCTGYILLLWFKCVLKYMSVCHIVCSHHYL